MLLDMYLFFCLPFPRPARSASSAAQKTRRRTPPATRVPVLRGPKADGSKRGTGRRAAASGSRRPSRPAPGAVRPGPRGKGRAAPPPLRVIDGGRAGVP
jgi:hypothetical protein